MLNENEVVSVLRQQKESGGRAKIYKEKADEHKGQLLSEDIGRKVSALRETVRRNRVDWDDVEDIQKRSLKYLEDCQAAQTIPTVSGLSVFALGVTRQGLNLYLREHPNTPTAQFLQQMKDIFADTLETAALNNNINTIMAIFVMKNDHDRADRLQVEPIQGNHGPLGEQLDEKTLTERLDALPDPDFDD